MCDDLTKSLKFLSDQDFELCLVENSMANISSRVHVGNLSWGVTSEDLLDHFVAHLGKSTVSSAAVERLGKRSRGFGFVHLSTQIDAVKAVGRMTDTIVGGRPIFVREERELQL